MLPARRRQHLLNGRRVQVLDLIKAGLVAPGDQLVYRRVQLGHEHIATVDSRGHLQVEGRTFKTLSGAAAALSGTQVDGWEAWVALDSGVPLRVLRGELLEKVAAETVASPDEIDNRDPKIVDRHNFLAQAAQRAQDGSPNRVPLSELYALWPTALESSDRVVVIAADIANYGLAPRPPLSSANVSDDIELVSSSQLERGIDSDAVGDGVSGQSGADRNLMAGSTQVRRIVIETLPSASAGVLSISPNADVEEAITRMAINDYSQLAVLSGPRDVKGAVSWQSIARARNINPNCDLGPAVFMPRIFELSDDLIDALPVLDDQDFFLVRRPDRTISGIVTSADVVGAYKELASPFLLIGEIDQMLRQIVEVTFDSDTILQACDSEGARGITSVAQLTVGDYLRILDHPDRWAELDWRLSRKIFCGQLDEVRKVRNSVMHFNGEGPSEPTLRMLTTFLRLLREYSTQ